MNVIIDKFYNESIDNIYNRPRLTKNNFSSPNLLQDKYSNINLRYNNGRNTFQNRPVPRTNFSMGLQAPTITGHPPFTHSTTIPFVTDPYSTIQKNYPDNVFKMHILENRINQMEEENKRDKLRIERLIEGSDFGTKGQTYFNSNPNYTLNPINLDQALNNLRHPFLTSEEIARKQALRREQVQYELEKARDKIDLDRYNHLRRLQNSQIEREKNYTISNYSEEEEDEEGKEDDEEDENSSENSESETYKMEKDIYKKLNRVKKDNEIRELEERVREAEEENNFNNQKINELRLKNMKMSNSIRKKEEEENFMNNIPDHVALQLQNDNFKMRSNLASIKEGFREIKNEIEEKLENLQMKQNLNYEMIRKIIEQGGNKKINAGMRKYLDGEEVDLKNMDGELDDYIKFLIDKKIRDKDEIDNYEKNLKLKQEIEKKYDLMEYPHNKFYDYNNRYRQPPRDPNFVISRNYGNFQYIPQKYKYGNSNRINNFRQKAENNLRIIKADEEKLFGSKGYGDRNMDDYRPIKMNGCFDDWYKDGNQEEGGGDFQINDSPSEEGINAIKKKVNSKNESNNGEENNEEQNNEENNGEENNEEANNEEENNGEENNGEENYIDNNNGEEMNYDINQNNSEEIPEIH